MPIQQVVPVDEDQLKPRHQRYSIDEGIDLNLYGIELEEPNMSVKRSISMSQPPGYIPQPEEEKEGYKFIPVNVYMWFILILVIIVTLVVAGVIVFWSINSTSYSHLHGIYIKNSTQS